MTIARFRIFISAPPDVFPERERLDRVIARLNGEYGGGVLEAIRWERAYYSATKTLQDQTPPPAETDLVICIFWKGLGFELPPDYRRPDGTTPTGTEYEFENAIQAARATGTPDVLVYRKAAPVLFDAQQVEIERAHFDLLNQFWARWFRSDAGHFTAAYQSFNTTDAFEAAVEEHIRQWLARHHMAGTEAKWPIALRGSPFRGLDAFDAGHSNVFFGRRRAIERARERLSEAASRGTPFLLILGASGSGKSSLALAGLLPRLVQPGAIAGIDVWRNCVVRPSAGDDPADALARALYAPEAMPELADGDSPTPADFAALLTAMPDAAARAVRLALTRATAELAAREQFGRPVTARLLLVVDQFEESLTDLAARDAFGRALAALVASGLVWIVATLRSDLYAMFQASAPLLQLRDGGAQLDLTRPTRADLGEMIEGPAAAAALTFGRDAQGVGLDEVLASAADQPGALPLLQLTLEALFQARDRDGNLTFAAYDELGRLPGVIERTAEAALRTLDPAAQAALPDVLRALVDLTDEGSITARVAPSAQFERTPAAHRLLAAFSAGRLLVVETQGGEPRLRVAHEALLSGWPRAAALIAADREALRTRSRIETAARTWLQEGRDSDFLLPHGRPLAEAMEFVEHYADSLDGIGMELVRKSAAAETAREAASRSAVERELRVAAEAQQARADTAISVARNTRNAAAVVFALLLLASGAAGVAFVEWQQAQRRTAEAERSFASALGAGATLVDTANAHLADGGLSRAVAQSLLDAAEADLGGLAEAGADAGPKLRDTEVQLLAGFSKVQLALCDSAGARARAAKAVEVAADTAAVSPSAPRKLALVRALDALGQAAYADGDRPAAVAAYRRAEQVGTGGLPDGNAAMRSVRRGLAAVITRDDRPAALQTFRDDLAWQDRAAAEYPDNPAILGLQASDLRRIADLTLALKQLPETEAALERETAVLQRLAALQPANMEWRHALVQSALQTSRLSFARGDASAALAQAQTAAQSAARVLAHDPDNAYWQRDVLNAQFNLYFLYERARDYPRMVEAMGPALAFVDRLTGPHVGLVCQSDAAALFESFGRGLLASAITRGLIGHEHAAATEAFEKSLSIRQAISRAAPHDRAAQYALAEAHIELATSYLSASHLEAGMAEYQAALVQTQRLLVGPDASVEWVELMVSLSSDYGGLQAAAGKTTEALATQEAIRSVAERVASARPDAAKWQHVIIVSQIAIAKIRAGQHARDQQKAALQDAVSRAERVAAMPQKPEDWRADLMEARKQRGGYELAVNAPQGAVADFRAALSLADELIAADPTNRSWPATRADLLAQLTQAGEMLGKAAKSAD